MSSQKLIVGAGVVVVLVLLAGCTGTQFPDQTTEQTPTQTLEPTTTTPTGQWNDSVTVVSVVDGDTIDVELSNGTVFRVRLIGVDTPETHSEPTPDEFEGVPDTETGVACLQASGEQASSHTRSELAGENVRLVFDENTDRRGYYGRVLAYVYVDGGNFNYGLVEDGFARVYDSDFTQADRFYSAESAAQSNKTGVWQCAT